MILRDYVRNWGDVLRVESGSGTTLPAQRDLPQPLNPAPSFVAALSNNQVLRERYATSFSDSPQRSTPKPPVDMSAPCMCSHNFIPWRGKRDRLLHPHWWVASSPPHPFPFPPSLSPPPPLSLSEWMKDEARGRREHRMRTEDDETSHADV